MLPCAVSLALCLMQKLTCDSQLHLLLPFYPSCAIFSQKKCVAINKAIANVQEIREGEPRENTKSWATSLAAWMRKLPCSSGIKIAVCQVPMLLASANAQIHSA